MGEFNINKSDGSLEQTAGMPETYPASQVTYGNGSVEDALDGLQAWSEEVDVQVTDGHFYFSKHPAGLKRIRYAISAPTSETTYANIIPDAYLPQVNTLVVGYNSNGGVRSGILYPTTKNILVGSSSQAKFFGQYIYT